jgi:hypothetical protein
MPFISSRPEQFRAELELVEPIDLASFNRLYIAIAKAIARDPNIRYQQPGDPVHTFHYGEKWSESDYEIGRARSRSDGNGKATYISIEAEGSPDQRSYGLMARASVTEPSDWTIYTLAVNKGLNYITEEYTGESIKPDELDRLVSKINSF